MADDMRSEARRLKGQRIELISCRDAYTRLEPGALGTITFVDDMGTVFVDWDDGHKLGLLPDVDSWRDLPARNLTLHHEIDPPDLWVAWEGRQRVGQFEAYELAVQWFLANGGDPKDLPEDPGEVEED